MSTTKPREQREELRFICHKVAAGGLIGPNGKNQQDIAKTTNCYLTINKFRCIEKRVGECIDNRVISLEYLASDKESNYVQLRQALEKVGIILKKERETAMKNLSFPRHVPADEYMFAILLSRFAAQLLVADQGKLLKPVQTESCNIRIRGVLPQSDDQVLLLKGQLEPVVNAIIYMVPYLTSTHIPPNLVNFAYQPYTPTMPVDQQDLIVERVVQLPKDQIRFVLGKNGLRIKDIRKLTSCTVHLPPESLAPYQQNEPADKPVSVIVKGPSKNISGAVQMVYYSPLVAQQSESIVQQKLQQRQQYHHYQPQQHLMVKSNHSGMDNNNPGIVPIQQFQQIMSQPSSPHHHNFQHQQQQQQPQPNNGLPHMYNNHQYQMPQYFAYNQQ